MSEFYKQVAQNTKRVRVCAGGRFETEYRVMSALRELGLGPHYSEYHAADTVDTQYMNEIRGKITHASLGGSRECIIIPQTEYTADMISSVVDILAREGFLAEHIRCAGYLRIKWM